MQERKTSLTETINPDIPREVSNFHTSWLGLNLEPFFSKRIC